MINQIKNPTFGGFKPDAMQRIAGTLGYSGDMSGFQQYLANNPDKQAQMDQFKQAAMTMARGGAVQKFNQGGFNVEDKPEQEKTFDPVSGKNLTASQLANRMSSPNLGVAYTTQQTGTGSTPTATQGTQISTQPFIPTQNGQQGYVDPMGNFTPFSDMTGRTGIYTDDTRGTGMVGTTGGTNGDLGTASDLYMDYDPRQGMPEPLSDPDFSTGYVLPNYAEGPLKTLAMGNTDLGSATVDGNTITFSDGKTIKANTPEEAQMIVTAATKYKTEVQDPYKAKEDAYREYLSSGVTTGVTGDIENIEQEYTNAQSNYTQQNLELQRLQQQAAANPDDPYLKELVEAKGKEVSDTYSRLQQLQPLYQSAQTTIKDTMTERATDPSLPQGAQVSPTLIGAPMEEELISKTSGQVTGAGGVDKVTLANNYLAQNVEQPDTAKYEADVKADEVAAQAQALNAAQTNENDPRAQIVAAETTKSMVSDLDAAQGTAHQMTNEVTRDLQAGEIVDGASTDATKAAKFTEQIDAATATPSEKATVQGQLVGLMEQFDGTTPPPWAAGAIRLANQQLASRGLGASSMAGQAVVQAAMEAALPIAQADAATRASFETQNLSNRQQRAMLAAQQRATFLGQEFDQDFQARVLNASKVSDIANMNFTADQQVQLENARMLQTMNLENLSNRQAMVLAEASALANLDLANLNNRQQAAVQNAQNFLQLDMANLSNEQQTELFKSQQTISSMLTDQAANNAAMQFNAQSENQANQFYDNLNSSINMFNSEQQNAQERFNAGQVNAMSQFNAEMKNQREQFNAQNQLVVDQSNATWRREIATADTAAINRANELNAINTLDISNTAYNNLWQMYSDQMKFAFDASENEAQRLNSIALQQLANDASFDLQNMKNDYNSSAAFGGAIVKMLTSDLTNTVLGGIF